MLRWLHKDNIKYCVSSKDLSPGQMTKDSMMDTLHLYKFVFNADNKRLDGRYIVVSDAGDKRLNNKYLMSHIFKFISKNIKYKK